jgi:ribosome maturation factor RimP
MIEVRNLKCISATQEEEQFYSIKCFVGDVVDLFLLLDAGRYRGTLTEIGDKTITINFGNKSQRININKIKSCELVQKGLLHSRLG